LALAAIYLSRVWVVGSVFALAAATLGAGVAMAGPGQLGYAALGAGAAGPGQHTAAALGYVAMAGPGQLGYATADLSARYGGEVHGSSWPVLLP
jgi:hypothetical protein